MNEIDQSEPHPDPDGADDLSPLREHMTRGIGPIRHLLSGVRFEEHAEQCSLWATIASGQVKLGVMLQADLLSLDVYVGQVAATPENYATLLAQNRAGPWWYRIDDVGSGGQAVVVRVCETRWSDVAHLDQLLLDGWRDYWSVQALLEVLNGQFDEP